MRKKIRLFALSVLAFTIVVACARGPVVPTPPVVRVTQFRSVLFTPQFVRFDAQVVINNRMRAPVDFQKATYGLSLFDKDLVDRTFAGMKQIRPYGQETLTLPLRIPMKRILAQNIAILARGKMRFTFRGSVYPAQASGFAPIPFSQAIEIPIPSIPKVQFVGASGMPLSPQFRLEIGIQNTNNFPISIDNVDTYLELNGQRYPMLRTAQRTDIPAGSSGTVVLTMHSSKTAGLSMALNLVENRTARFDVGGSFTAGTPYGYVFIPVEIKAKQSSG